MNPVPPYEDSLRLAGRSSDTIKRRAGTLRRFLTFIHPHTIDQATVDDVEAFLRQFPAAATRAAYLGDLRHFFRWSKRRRLFFGDDPTEPIDPIHVPPNEPRPLDPADLARAVMLADDRLRLILMLGALAGLRRAEIAGLHGEDIGERMIRVRHAKGGRSRSVPIHPVLRAELDRWGVRRGPLFPRADDPTTPITRDWLGRLVGRHFEALDIAGATHRLRHTAASTLAEVARDPYLVAEFLGHLSLDTSMVYVRASGTRLAEHVTALPDPRAGVA